MRTYTHIFKGGDICVHVLSSCGTPAVLRVCPGLLDWRAHCGKASPLECQSPSPSTSRTSPSPLWRQRICSTSQWTPPPEWVERKRSLQKQNLLSKALLDQAPSKANGPAWTSKLSCWVSSGEQTAGTLHHSRGRLCRPDQKKGLNTRSSKRGRGSGPGSAHPPPIHCVMLLSSRASLLSVMWTWSLASPCIPGPYQGWNQKEHTVALWGKWVTYEYKAVDTGKLSPQRAILPP